MDNLGTSRKTKFEKKVYNIRRNRIFTGTVGQNKSKDQTIVIASKFVRKFPTCARGFHDILYKLLKLKCPKGNLFPRNKVLILEQFLARIQS